MEIFLFTQIEVITGSIDPNNPLEDIGKPGGDPNDGEMDFGGGLQ